MARTAEALGVPSSSIYPEPEALNTIQNACYAVRIMKEHGWRSAEIVSSASHLPRAGLIFSRTAIEWRAHPAPPLEPEDATLPPGRRRDGDPQDPRYLVYASWAHRCE